MNKAANAPMAKVPQPILPCGIIKIATTTLGETGGDALAMSWLDETLPGANGGG